ncbi:hypothetical protein [Leisingera aquaemixtae]|uniref:hypothetical protein n=1 Tax=Leisingera aquaemixtae TaxID=1396826 RepID=UPI0011AE266F|nr:hypothetical protein [Leisingera aquaemixtae]
MAAFPAAVQRAEFSGCSGLLRCVRTQQYSSTSGVGFPGTFAVPVTNGRFGKQRSLLRGARTGKTPDGAAIALPVFC